MDNRLKPWETLSEQTIADCSPWLRVKRDHVRLPNGVEIPDFYRVEMPEYVMTFALTTDHEVVMIQHYKHGASMVSLELPAGYIEDSSTEPLANAQRELREETGYQAQTWHYLGKFFIDGNRGCGEMHGYVATGATPVAAQELEPTELIVMQATPLKKVEAMWLSGEIRNVAVVALVGLAIAHLKQTGEV